MRLFDTENKNIDMYKFKIKVLVVLLFSGAGGLQKTPEELLSLRSPIPRRWTIVRGRWGGGGGGRVGMRPRTGARWTLATWRVPPERSQSVLMQSLYRFCSALSAFIGVHSQFSLDASTLTENGRIKVAKNGERMAEKRCRTQ